MSDEIKASRASRIWPWLTWLLAAAVLLMAIDGMRVFAKATGPQNVDREGAYSYFVLLATICFSAYWWRIQHTHLAALIVIGCLILASLSPILSTDASKSLAALLIGSLPSRTRELMAVWRAASTRTKRRWILAIVSVLAQFAVMQYRPMMWSVLGLAYVTGVGLACFYFWRVRAGVALLITLGVWLVGPILQLLGYYWVCLVLALGLGALTVLHDELRAAWQGPSRPAFWQWALAIASISAQTAVLYFWPTRALTLGMLFAAGALPVVLYRRRTPTGFPLFLAVGVWLAGPPLMSLGDYWLCVSVSLLAGLVLSSVEIWTPRKIAGMLVLSISATAVHWVSGDDYEVPQILMFAGICCCVYGYCFLDEAALPADAPIADGPLP